MNKPRILHAHWMSKRLEITAIATAAADESGFPPTSDVWLRIRNQTEDAIKALFVTPETP